MEAIAGLVVALASLGLVFGLINVIYPIKALRVRTRKRGLAILGGSLLLIVIFGSFLPDPSPDLQPEAAPTSVASTVVSTTETSESGAVTTQPSTPGTSTTSTTTTPTTVTTTTTVVTTTTLPPTVDEQVEAAVREVVDDDHFISTVITEVDPDSYVVAVVLEGSENLTLNLTAGGICVDVSELFRGVFDLGHDIQLVSIEVMFPFVDQFGNVELNRAVLARLEGETYSKINQDTDDATLNFDIIPGLTDWLFVHPSFAATSHFTEVLN